MVRLSFECGSVAPAFGVSRRRRIGIGAGSLRSKSGSFAVALKSGRSAILGYAEISPRLARAVMRSAAR